MKNVSGCRSVRDLWHSDFLTEGDSHQKIKCRFKGNDHQVTTDVQPACPASANEATLPEQGTNALSQMTNSHYLKVASRSYCRIAAGNPVKDRSFRA